MTLHLKLLRESPETVSHLSHLRLAAEFENRGRKPLTVLIDATPLSHGEYDLEFTDDRDRPVDASILGMCGTVSPLQEHEILVVEPGATLRTPVHAGRGTLGPGSYRARVRYEAHRSDHGRDSLSPVVAQRLKHFWTGTLRSNWIPFAVTGK